MWLEEPCAANHFWFTVRARGLTRRFLTQAEALAWITQQGGIVVEAPMRVRVRLGYGEAVCTGDGDQYLSY